MKSKPKRNRLTTADLMSAINGLDGRLRTTASELQASISALDAKFTGALDTRTEELKGLIDRRAGDVMNGLHELHSFTEFSLGRLEERQISRMDRRFDLVDKRFDEIDIRFDGLEARLGALEAAAAG
jgi:hypothetical protein